MALITVCQQSGEKPCKMGIFMMCVCIPSIPVQIFSNSLSIIGTAGMCLGPKWQPDGEVEVDSFQRWRPWATSSGNR
jgi:hypothetical protein